MSDSPNSNPNPNPTPPPPNGNGNGNQNGNGRTTDRNRALLPILLIGAGVLLLLGRVGLFDWSFAFGVLQLWPLFLIAAGVDILTRGKFRLAVVIGTVVLAAILWRAPAWSPVGGAPAEVRTIEYPLDGARAIDLDIEHGVGHLQISELSGSDGRALIGTIATGRGETLEANYRLDDGVAEIELSSEQRGSSFSMPGRDGERRWDLELAQGVPLDLTIDSGVGESRLDLRDLTLQGFDLDAGVGSVFVTLSENGGYEGSLDAGVGEVTVRIPESVEVRMQVETGLGAVNVRGSWIRDGGDYRTEGYDDAREQDRIVLDLSGGVGEITVERVD